MLQTPSPLLLRLDWLSGYCSTKAQHGFTSYLGTAYNSPLSFASNYCAGHCSGNEAHKSPERLEQRKIGAD